MVMAAHIGQRFLHSSNACSRRCTLDGSRPFCAPRKFCRTAAQRRRHENFQYLCMFVLSCVVSVATMFGADPPPWAYGFEGPPQAGATPVPVGPANTDQTLRSIPGATAQYARAQIGNRFGPADWFPGDHPQDARRRGSRRAARCACLRAVPLSQRQGPRGKRGHRGLPVDYFIQQMNDFRNGNRKSADPRKANTNAHDPASPRT